MNGQSNSRVRGLGVEPRGCRHQMGGGRGKDALTVLGAVGGAVAGHEIEKNVRAETVYSVKVRMDDGTLRTLTRKEPIAVGARVRVDGNALSAA